MAIRNKAEYQTERVIDLTGPDGNAFALMGYARRFARQLDWSPHEIDAVISEMMSGDYEHLVQTFDDNFGKFVTLLR
jgi:hypothetical protein